MRKKILSVLLCTAMAATMLTGCGGKDSGSGSSSSDKGSSSKSEVVATDDGKVFNIRVWNTEFKERVEEFYPDYEKVDDNTGKIGDIQVNWITVANQDNAYQNALDEALTKQATASADDKVDMFLVEADYAAKYTEAGDAVYALDLINDLGISEDTLANQFKYTQEIVKDSNGALRGASWQGTPAGLVYRSDIAKKVFGSDDPEKVQEYFSDWDKFAESAKTLKDAGYKVTATVNDTFRVFSNNVTSKWVEDGKINIDEQMKKWVDMSKEMVDSGQTTTEPLWDSEWQKGFDSKGDVFAYFGPSWFFDFSMADRDDNNVPRYDLAKDGKWRLCAGPQNFYWGGTWLCAANGTDNKTLVKTMIETMTADETVMTEIAKGKTEYVNNQNVVDALASDEKFGSEVLGGQNPVPLFNEGVTKIDLSNLTKYDQGCTEEFQTAMKEYFDGNVTYDEALEAFYKAVETKYPELSH
ncbi:MAG: ABC transporter substrate-binding protein [Lachnospiraceae bacterium]|nr:ABC transporter substrate-binding protein [Lachnospiraceae bacterium]